MFLEDVLDWFVTEGILFCPRISSSAFPVPNSTDLSLHEDDWVEEEALPGASSVGPGLLYVAGRCCSEAFSQVEM